MSLLDIARAPEVAPGNEITVHRTRHRFHTPFPEDENLHRWRLGFTQYNVRHITRVLPARHSWCLDTTAGVHAMLWSPSPFGTRVSHRTQELSSEFLLT